MKQRDLIGVLVFDVIMLLLIIAFPFLSPSASLNVASLVMGAAGASYFLFKLIWGTIDLLFDGNYGF